jgi:hypothetical protein
MLNPAIPQQRVSPVSKTSQAADRAQPAEGLLPVLQPDTVLKAAVISGLILLLTLLASRPAR